MPYAVPQSRKSIAQNQFEFTLPADPERVYSVPLLQYLKPSFLLAAEDLTELALAKLLFDTYLPEAFDLFEDAEQLTEFMKAWSEVSGVTPGESPASAAS